MRLPLRSILLALLLGQLGWLQGCSSHPADPPSEQIELALQAINQAQKAGAVRWAPAEWAQTQRLYDEANEALDTLQYTLASQKAERAQAWAELAAVRAQRARIELQLNELPQLFE